MLLKRNILEYLTILSCTSSLVCIALNYLTNISPITGIWFPVYVIFVSVFSITFCFKLLQWLLHLSKPIKYDIEVILRTYPVIKSVFPKSYFDKRFKFLEDEIENGYDTNKLSVISTVLERKLVSSWYISYISEEIGFPFACKQMLDQIINKAFQICNNIETKEFYVDICSILISHLKEYKKAVKRQQKSSGTIDSHYKKSHPISDNTSKKACPSAEHCSNILRLLMKDLVPWELWDTPHSELLVRILSKRLDDFIDNTLTDPVWLNDKLHSLLSEKTQVEAERPKQENLTDMYFQSVAQNENFDIYNVPSEPIFTELSTIQPTIESALSTLITESTAPILHRGIEEELADELNINVNEMGDADDVRVSEPVDIQSIPQLRQRRGRQGRNEVKIYDRVIEGSVKTWETDMDLQCISLGQDLLASLDGEITLSRLWEQDAPEPGDGWSPNPQALSKSPQPLWFGEEDIEMEMNNEWSSPRKERSPTKKEHSPKPADALLKDLQSTVTQAKTKIVDLQVATEFDTDIDVPRKQPHTGDEAAGMMEGLLDFGIAGLKKGLRFTGLHDNTLEKSPSHYKEKILEHFSPLEGAKYRNLGELDEDYTPTTLLQREEHAPLPPLIKQNCVSSQDSMGSQPRPLLESTPVPQPVPLNESPEPEYEDTPDLSSSIAKLRSLLHQGNDGSPPMAWMVAEETRGRTQRHPSSRPVDTATLADEYDMNTDRISLPEQTTNNMQRLDKLFHRTMTGMFNSIKTAVGAEGDEPGALRPEPEPERWRYVCTSIELSMGCSVARLVGSVRAGGGEVDAGLDSLHQLGGTGEQCVASPHDTDDFEEWCSMCGARAVTLGELGCGAGLWGSHVTHRVLTVLLADLAECIISAWLVELSASLREGVFLLFGELSREPNPHHSPDIRTLRALDLEHTCALVMSRAPVVLQLLGSDSVESCVRTCLSSLTHRQVNKDLVLRLLDLTASHLKRSAGISRSYDVN